MSLFINPGSSSCRVPCVTHSTQLRHRLQVASGCWWITHAPLTAVAPLCAAGALVAATAKRRSHITRGGLRRRARDSDPTGTCKKTIWFIRHGQSEHNVLYHAGHKDAAISLLDPELTDKGRQQAVGIAQDPLLVPALSRGWANGLQLVVASPLRRTVDTAILAFQDWLMGESKKKGWRRVHLLGDLKEIGREVVPCNTGSPLDVLKERFKVDAKLVDYRELQPGWDQEDGLATDYSSAVRARLKRLCGWLAQRKESRIAVVAHHNLLAALLGVSFFNVEVRQYGMVCHDDNVELVPEQPRVSATDAELSDADRRHLDIYVGTVGRLFTCLDLPSPARLR